MAIISYPFESLNTGTPDEPVYDRAITAEDERTFNKLRYTNGVFSSVGDALAVTANGSMGVTVGTGGCHVEGALMYNTAPLRLTLEAANASLARIDRVAARFNTSTSVRAVIIAVKTGQAATNPVAPDLVREPNFYEVALADVYVKKGAASIAASAITDQRLNSALCGYVMAAIPTPVDTSGLWRQYQASLDEWLGTVAGALDGTLAGNLQNQLGALKEAVGASVVGAGDVLNLPVAASLYTGQSEKAGKLVIKLPQGFVGTMVKFTVEVLGHYGESLAEYDVFGQVYGGGTWSHVSSAIARGWGPLSNLPVAFGKEGGKAAIAIGEPNTKWNTYSAAKVKDFTGYFAKHGYADWAQGWDLSIGAPAGEYTVAEDAPADYQVSAETVKMFADAGYPIT